MNHTIMKRAKAVNTSLMAFGLNYIYPSWKIPRLLARSGCIDVWNSLRIWWPSLLWLGCCLIIYNSEQIVPPPQTAPARTPPPIRFVLNLTAVKERLNALLFVLYAVSVIWSIEEWFRWCLGICKWTRVLQTHFGAHKPPTIHLIFVACVVQRSHTTSN